LGIQDTSTLWDSEKITQLFRLKPLTSDPTVASSFARGSITLLTDIDFGNSGNSSAYLESGWSGQEPGWRWSVGNESRIVLPALSESAELVLEIWARPMTAVIIAPSRELIVSVNGISSPSGRFSISQGGRWAYRIPSTAVKPGAPLRIALEHPGVGSGRQLLGANDDRHLAFAFERIRLYCLTNTDAMSERLAALNFLSLGSLASAQAVESASAEIACLTGLTPDKLVTHFESLGQSCEFGLLQRQCGAEPLGLLRFSYTFLPKLLQALDADYEGLGTLDSIATSITANRNREYVIREATYGLRYHTFIAADQMTAAELVAREVTRLGFLRRKHLDDLQTGEKICVCIRYSKPLSEHEILPLFLALQRHGPNTLLWVVPTTPDNPSGSVEKVTDRLFRGFIDRLAPDDNAHDMLVAPWLSICANAYLLASKARTRNGSIPSR
jgi:hypothetical protein